MRHGKAFVGVSTISAMGDLSLSGGGGDLGGGGGGGGGGSVVAAATKTIRRKVAVD